MEFNPNLTDYKDLLEVYRRGLVLDIVDKVQIIAWADGIIKAATEPDYFFIELSLAKDKNEIIEAITNVNGLTPNAVTSRALLGILYHNLIDKKLQINRVTPILDNLNNREIISEIESAWLYQLSDDYDWNNPSVIPIEQAKENLLSFLSKYQEFNVGNYRSWDEINDRLQPLFTSIETQLENEYKAVSKTERVEAVKRKINFSLTGLILLGCMTVLIAFPFLVKGVGPVSDFSKYGLPVLAVLYAIFRILSTHKSEKEIINSTKHFLRQQYLAKRQQLTIDEYDTLNQQLLQQFQELDLSNIRCIHLFLPIREKREPDTYLIRDWLKANHPEIKIVFPKTNFRTLAMKSYADDEALQLAENAYGIPEPVAGNVVDVNEIDLVILPLLIFDTLGYRVGYGKGFYDRFTALCKPGTKFIGLSLFEPVGSIEDVNELDVWMHACLSPGQKLEWR
ncbi:MAG: 5-formyltetrahydrofolate cyclo-ligase [Bacteroidota bacterium]